ncbi:MAG: hypothetical protein WKF87_01330 [Chryseolinea sp.]
MMRLTILYSMVLMSWVAMAQPGTEIFLFDLKVKNDELFLTNGRNITNRKGYDNQPHFHPEEALLYYVSADSTGQTDIYFYNYVSGNTTRLTKTRDREYSPTVTPNKKFISCIIQRESGAQDFGKYPIKGGNELMLVNNLTVGYHTWMNDETLALFVLGEPPTLRLFDIAKQTDSTIAKDIGRSLHRIPKKSAISFVQKSGNEWLINQVDEKTKNISTVVSSLPNREDLAWTPDGLIIMSDGKKLFFINPLNNKGWREIKVQSTFSLKAISRISINAKGDLISLVAEE